jgi:hypothetical protein
MALSFESKINTALQSLKEANATKYAEVTAALPGVLDAKGKPFNIEAQCAFVEAALAALPIKESGLELFTEDVELLKGDYPALFNVKPRTLKETAPVKLVKNNGAEGNGHSGEAIIESVLTSKKEAQVAGIMQELKLTENAARSFLGLKPKGPAGLDAKQAKSYSFARAIGIVQ